jgi:hypothetical protein
LGLVHGDGVAVRQVAAGDIAGRDPSFATAVERDEQLELSLVDLADGGGVAVQQVQIVAVAQGHDPVADSEGDVVDTQLGAREQSVLGQATSGEAVEVVDVLAGASLT